MPLGKSARKNDLKAYALKVKIKDLPSPQFEIHRREGDEYVKLPETESEVGGNLLGVEPREFLYQGSPIRSFTVTLQDNDEIYFVSIPLNNLGRGLANSLLALADKGQFNDVSIGLYNTKPKTEGGRAFAAASLRQAGEIVRWKFPLESLPKPDEVTFKGQIQRDYTKQEMFLSEQLRELNKVIRSKAPAQVTATSESTPEPEKEDVPF